MKLHPVLPACSALLCLSLFLFSSAAAMDDPGFVINRMVMCAKITDREPVGVTDTFAAAKEKVNCFLEAGEIERDTLVTFVWYFEGREMARVTLPLAAGKRWRTSSSKRLAGLRGSWKVELREASGIVLNTVSFQVQ